MAAIADGSDFVVVPYRENAYEYVVFTDEPYRDEESEYDDVFWKPMEEDAHSDLEATMIDEYEYVRYFDEMNVVVSPFR